MFRETMKHRSEMTLLLTLVYFGLRSELFKIRANKDLKYTENVRYGKKPHV